MIKDMKILIDADEEADDTDLRLTAHMLLAKQFLLEGKQKQRSHFDRVLRYQKYYRDLMDALNHRLVINENRGYVGIVPEVFINPMKLEEALILLALRYIYDEELNAFNLEEDGSVLVSFEDFADRYIQITKREMPKQLTVFQGYLKGFESHGILYVEKDKSDPPVERIRICPTISELLGGNAIEKLAGYLMAKGVQVTEKPDFEEDETESNDSDKGGEQS